MSNKMNICLACNDLYFDLLVVAIHSIQKYNQNLNFFIYLNSKEKHHFDRILELISSNYNDIYFFLVEDVSDVLPPYLKQHEYISLETYFRLLIPNLILEDKILYLDVDLIVRGSLKQLYNSALEPYGIGAVPYSSSLKWLGNRNLSINLDYNHLYFNAGVLMLNLVSLRENGLFDNALKLIEDNNELNDQDALNIASKNNFYKLANEYNWSLHDVKSKINPLIVHFAGPFKPNIKFYVHPYALEFKLLYKEILPDKKFVFNLAYIKSSFIKAKVKELLRLIK